MATKPNYEKINEDKRKEELSKRQQELKTLTELEKKVSRYGESNVERIQHLTQEIKTLESSDRNISHKALYEMEVADLKVNRDKLKKKLDRKYIASSDERKWESELASVNQKIKTISKQYTYLAQQEKKDEISTGLDQLLESGNQEKTYYGKENKRTDELLTKISKHQGNVPENLYTQLDNIVTKGQEKLLGDADQLKRNDLVKISMPDKSFEKTETVKNILNNAEKYKKNCVVMFNNFGEQNYVVKDALKDYGEHLNGNKITNSASVKVINFVLHPQKAVESRQQTSKIETPDKNTSKKDQVFYQEVSIPSGRGTTKEQESFTQASNPSVSGRVSLVSNEFDARETSTDVAKDAAVIKAPESKITPTEVKGQEASSRQNYPRYSTVNGQVIKDETGISKNNKKIFVLNSSISNIKEELGKAVTQRKVFTDRGKTIIGRIRNFFSKGKIKQLDNTISSCKEKIEIKQNELAQLENPKDTLKGKPQQSFEQVTDRSKEKSQDRSKKQGTARNKKEVVTELA